LNALTFIWRLCPGRFNLLSDKLLSYGDSFSVKLDLAADRKDIDLNAFLGDFSSNIIFFFGSFDGIKGFRRVFYSCNSSSEIIPLGSAFKTLS
jgi:hypothetical protein